MRKTTIAQTMTALLLAAVVLVGATALAQKASLSTEERPAFVAYLAELYPGWGGLLAATWLSQQGSPQPGFGSYDGYPMPASCDHGTTSQDNYNQAMLWLHQRFCSPDLQSATARLAVLSAHEEGSSTGKTVVLNGSRPSTSSHGLSAWRVALSCGKLPCKITEQQYEYYGDCSNPQPNGASCVGVGSVTGYPYTYATQEYGSIVVPPGTSVTLEWSCQNSQQNRVNYRWCEKNFFGSCYNIVNTLMTNTYNFSNTSSGTNFSTGGALTGSVTVAPTVDTTYTLTCGGYRYTPIASDINAGCSGGVTTCVRPDSSTYSAGRALASSMHQGLSLTVLMGVPTPTVTTNPATSVTYASAVLNGAANPNNYDTTGWFRYATSNPGSCSDSFGTRVPAASAVGYGSDGGAGIAGGTGGGGGGGAGSAGSAAPETHTGGAGGAGYTSSISGAAVTYGGGGGGGGQTAGGAGGTGGGGAGGNNTAVAGTNGLGGGGGGARSQSTSARGANGGSGVVIVRYPVASISATGGTVVESGGYRIHTFTSNGSFEVTSGSGNIEYLVVGGGGGGGSRHGGGGGGGGIIHHPSAFVSAGSYPVVVGAGGTWTQVNASTGSVGTNGGNSSFLSSTALGGGGGGSYTAAVPTGGGSGGGGGGGQNTAAGLANQQGGGGGGGTSLGGGNTAVDFSQTLGNLESGETYYYCAIAENEYGLGFGSVESFTTAVDICTDIPGGQVTTPPGCQTPNPSPGECIPAGYAWDGAQCVIAPPVVADFYADPPRVRRNAAPTLHWSVENPPESCTITGTDGYSATVSGASGSVTADPIAERTVYTLSCGGVESEPVVVTILPEYREI